MYFTIICIFSICMDMVLYLQIDDSSKTLLERTHYLQTSLQYSGQMKYRAFQGQN
jgi:hypothetical protein